MDNIWLDILKEALKTLCSRTDAPVAGAKLQSDCPKLAEDRGAQFPPEGMTKWSAFLASFPNDITVIPNRGSDVLVVPANRPDLQAVAIATAAATATAPAFTRLRSDIFEALTRIPSPGERAVYLPEADAVLWQGDDEVAPPNAVPFPPATLEAEVDVRRQFAERDASVTDAAKDALRQAFESEGPLRQFTHTIRSYGLLQTWHLFRMSALTKRLREWAEPMDLFRGGMAWVGQGPGCSRRGRGPRSGGRWKQERACRTGGFANRRRHRSYFGTARRGAAVVDGALRGESCQAFSLPATSAAWPK
jgi:hypothetical protein